MNHARYTRPPKPLHLLVFALVWLGLGAALLWVLAEAEETPLSLLLYLILHVLAGGGWLAVTVHRLVMHARLEEPELNVLNARPHLGEKVTFDVRLHAGKHVKVSRVLAVLTCSEEVRKAHRHESVLPTVVYRHEEVLGTSIELKPGEPHDIPGQFVIPPDGMQSFQSHLCEVKWRLDVLILVGRHLSYHEREELSVQPVRIAAQEAAT